MMSPARLVTARAELASVEKGENARMASFVGAIAIADLVKSSITPSKTLDRAIGAAMDAAIGCSGGLRCEQNFSSAQRLSLPDGRLSSAVSRAVFSVGLGRV